MKTVKTITVCLSLVLFTYSGLAQEFEIGFKDSDKAVEMAKKYTNALMKGDVASMNALFSEKAMVYGLGTLDSMTVKQHGEYYTTSTADYTHNLQNQLYFPVSVSGDDFYQGDWILTWGTNIVTNKKNQKVSPVPYHVALNVVDGKFVRAFYFYDLMKMMAKQGYTVNPPKD